MGIININIDKYHLCLNRGEYDMETRNFINRRSNRKTPPRGLLFIYILTSIFFMETMLRLSTTGKFFSIGTVLSLIFAMSISIFLYIISSIFKDNINYIIFSIILFFLGIIFASQLVYYKIFKTFYTAYSAGNAGQIVQFWSEALDGVKGNIFLILLLFIPFVLFLFKGKEIVYSSQLKISHIVIGLAASTLIHFMGLGIIGINKDGENSPYNLYHNIHYPNFSVSNLGLLTYMRLDTKRQIVGWSSIFTGDSPNMGEDIPSYQDNDESEEEMEYNIMDIDFDELIDSESNEEIIEMHEYFKNVKPSEKNDYTGIYEDYNLIILTAEGFSHLAVDKDITPTLYKMIHEGYYFKNFYTPIWGVSTSDGEYVANTGLIPKSGVWSFKESSKIDMPLAMGNQLNQLGYSTRAYHNHTYDYYDRDLSHPNMGYDYKGLGNGLEVKETWPESDIEMMEKTIPEYIDDQPFHTYYMTVSGHMKYSFEGNYIANKNRDLVKDLPYSNHAQAYLATQIELDRALEYLLEKLEKAGIADKTLIALSADHYPYGLEVEKMEELAGKDIEENFELYRNAFILYTEGMEPETIEEPASSLDIIPTISNLLAIEYDSRLLMGRDLLSDTEALIIFSNRSFITPRGKYNSETKTYTPNENYELDEDAEDDEEYRKKISNIINAKFFYSAKILDRDYYSKVLDK